MTYSLRSMIRLLQQIFGDHFWNHTILEATHWNYHSLSDRIRNRSSPPITEALWSDQFNSLLALEYGVKVRTPLLIINFTVFYYVTFFCHVFCHVFISLYTRLYWCHVICISMYIIIIIICVRLIDIIITYLFFGHL